jgi:hypothetical protein
MFTHAELQRDKCVLQNAFKHNIFNTRKALSLINSLFVIISLHHVHASALRLNLRHWAGEPFPRGYQPEPQSVCDYDSNRDDRVVECLRVDGVELR